MLARPGPALALGLLLLPVLAGLAGTVLPAFGYLPILGGTRLTLQHFAVLFGQPGILHSALISLAAGLVTAVMALGTVFLFVAAHAGTPFFRRVQHLVSPLLSVPHASAAFAFAFLIAPSGLLVRLVSPGLTGWERPPDLLLVQDRYGLAMMAGLVIKEIPFLFLMTLAALPQVRLPQCRAIASTLGYGRIAGFACTAWPSVYRQIRLAVFAVIAFSSSTADVAAILGPTTPPTLAVRILDWMNDPGLSGRYLASAAAVLQLLLTLTAILAWFALERVGRAMLARCIGQGMRLRRDRTVALAGAAAITTAAVAVLAGLGSLAVWSVAGPWPFPDLLPSSWTTRSWEAAWPRIGGPLATTLVTGLASTALATLLALSCLTRERALPGLSRLVFAPLVVPEICFLSGLNQLFVLTGAEPGICVLVLTHLIFVLPYVFLSLGNHWRGFDRRYEFVAAALGKPRWQVLLRIRLPMLLPAVLTAAAVGFAVSVGLYLPTLLIGGGRLTTITTEAVALASGGNRRVIGVYAVLQLLLPMAGFLIATCVPALLFRSRRGLQV
jgi:putative thiamine transport system permease protein